MQNSVTIKMHRAQTTGNVLGLEGRGKDRGRQRRNRQLPRLPALEDLGDREEKGRHRLAEEDIRRTQ